MSPALSTLPAGAPGAPGARRSCSGAASAACSRLPAAPPLLRKTPRRQGWRDGLLDEALADALRAGGGAAGRASADRPSSGALQEDEPSADFSPPPLYR